MSIPSPSAAAPALPSGTDEQTVFRSLFFAYPDSMLLVDQAGVIVLANPSAAELLGCCRRPRIGPDIGLVPMFR